MRNVWKYSISVFAVIVLISGSVASADSLTSGTEPVKELDPTLTVFFSPAPEFDQSEGTGLPVFNSTDVSSGDGELAGGGFGDDPDPEFPVDSNDFVGQAAAITPLTSVSGGTDGGDVPAVKSVSGAVPEPGTLILLGLGVLGLLGIARRKKH